MTGDLVTWLREQIAMTEEWARDVLQRPWLAEDNFVLDENGGQIARFEIKADARHAALNEPRAVLAGCESHTAILDLHAHERPYPKTAPDYIGCRVCDVSVLDGSLNTGPNEWCGTVRAVGVAYRHNPGYREEWGL